GLEINSDQLNKRLITPLSDREFEILMLAVSDKSNSEIADQIFVSVNTVKYHLKNIYEKLGVSNRKEALQFAINPTKS
ncbi:MAG: helix-turn-helix transcriptional regulator, partial [Cyclobacteriaceae bacterium]